MKRLPTSVTFIGDVCGCWEVMYCIKVLHAWPDIGGGYFKAGKFNRVSPKYKFVRVEDDVIVTTDVEPLNCLEEALSEIVGPEKRVINAISAGLCRAEKTTGKQRWWLLFDVAVICVVFDEGRLLL